jgi:hypothetical protein
MKKLLLFAGALVFFNTLSAQDYVPLQVTSGYNADVIANGVGPALLSTTNTFDSFEFVLLSSDYQLLNTDPINDFGLNPSGLITNAATPGLNYQLASFSSDNSLRLEFESDLGQFTIGNPVSATAIYVLAACGNGAGTLGGTIHFSDNSTQDIPAGIIPDWFFSTALPVVASGFGRVGRDTDLVENPAGDPRFYQYQIAILAENQTKTITSIDFTKTSIPEAVINIFAVSAQELGTCPAPTQLTVAAVTNFGATINWTPSVILPANGYEYYIGVGNTPPTVSTLPTGSVSNGVTTLNLSALSTGETYCVWVRSVCSETETGPWSNSICFTPGQIDVTNPNDIPTLYNLTVDVNSTTTCPGTLSLTVPDGYIITSVDTSYDMQTALNGWMSEQRSILVCNTTGMMESDVTAGVGGTTGTYSYSRTGLGIANGASGTVEFELRAWRTYGSSDCNTDYNRVVAGTWTVTATVQLPFATKNFTQNNFTVYPNPADDVVTISGNEMISEITVLNLLGQQVLHQNGLNAKLTQVSTAGLPSGKYLLRIASESGVQSKSILKN